MAALEFDISLHGKQLQADIEAINKRLSSMVKNTENAGSKMDAVFSRLAGAMAGFFSVNFGAQFVTSIARVRGEFQQLSVAFETMLDSKEKADKLMAQVVDFAAKTPFELKDVAAGTKSLLAFGVTSEEIIPTLKALGDVAAGLSVPIDRLILNFGQIKTQGQLTGRELRDFAVAGVPLVATLSKTLNKSEKDIQDMVSAGKIGFKEVSDAFVAMSSEGGRFANLMEKQSKTITGMQANLRDAWDRMLNDIGEQNEGALAGSIQAATKLVDNYEDVIKILKILVATYGAYKAAVIASTVASQASIMAGNVRAWFQLAAGIKTAKDAQIAFNLASKANPYGLILAAVASLVSAFVLFGKKANEAAKAGAEFEASLTLEKTKLDELLQSVKKANTGTTDRTKAVKEADTYLKQYNVRLTDENGKLRDIATVYKEATAALTKFVAEQAKANELAKAADILNTEALTTLQKSQQGYGSLGIKLSAEDITLLNEFIDQNAELINIRAKLSGKMYQTLTGEEKTKIEQYNGLITEMVSKSKNLRDIYTYSTGDLTRYVFDATSQLTKFRERVGDIDTFYSSILAGGNGKSGPETIIKNKEYWDNQKAELETKINALDSSAANFAQSKADYERQLLDIEGELSKYKVKNIERTIRETEATEEKRLKIQQDTAERELDLTRRTQAAKIAIMKEGSERQRAEAEYNHQQEIDQINKAAEQYLATINSDMNLAPDVKEAKISFLNDNVREQRKAADQKYANDLIQIEAEAANRIKAIWDEVADVFQSDQEREVTAVNEKYQALIKEAIKANNLILATDLEAAREREKVGISNDYEMQRIDFAEEIAMRELDIRKKSGENFYKIEREKNQKLQQIVKERIKILERSALDEDKQTIAKLKVLLKELGTEFENISKDEADNMLGTFRELSGMVGEINSEFGQVLGTMGKLAESGKLFADNLGLGGDKMQMAMGAFGFFSTAISLFAQASQNIDYTSQEKQLERMNRLLQTMEQLMASLSGDEFFTASDMYINRLQASLEAERKKLKIFNLEISKGKWVSFDLPKMDTKELVEFIAKFQQGGEFFEQFGKNSAMMKYIDDKMVIVNNMLEIEGKLDNATNDLYERITGTTTVAISDSILEGFKNGYDSAEDFAATFEELMKNAVWAALQEQLMTDELKQWYERLYEFSKDGLTKEEIEELKNNPEWGWNAIINASKIVADGLRDITGMDFGGGSESDTNRNSIIRGITEETGSLVVGQFFAMRENLLDIKGNVVKIRDGNEMSYAELLANRRNGDRIADTGLMQLDAINQSVTHLAGIEKNTRDIAKLNSIDARLEELNRNIKSM